MKISQIFSEWENDSKIDLTELDSEALKIPKLHHKYYLILCHEKELIRKLSYEMKKLYLEKHEFYTQGPSKETKDRGWEMPSIGKILRSDVSTYIDADPNIIDLKSKIEEQQEKIDLLESIIKGFVQRGYNIKTALDFQKFKMGL